jgi:hypothetical protein
MPSPFAIIWMMLHQSLTKRKSILEMVSMHDTMAIRYGCVLHERKVTIV